MKRMRVLFVTFGLPYPPDSGVRIHDFYPIKNISRHHSILLLSLILSPEQVEHLDQLRRYCDMVDLVLAKLRSTKENISGIVSSLLNGRPLSTHPFIYDEMMSKISKVVSKYDPDIVQIEHSFLAPYIEAIPAYSNCKKILSFHNLAFSQYKRMFQLGIATKGKFLFLLKWVLMGRWKLWREMNALFIKLKMKKLKR